MRVCVVSILRDMRQGGWTGRGLTVCFESMIHCETSLYPTDFISVY